MRRSTEHATLRAGLGISLAVHASLLLVLSHLQASAPRTDGAAVAPAYEIQLALDAPPEPVEVALPPPPVSTPVPNAPAAEPEPSKPELAAVPSLPAPEDHPTDERPAPLLTTSATPEEKAGPEPATAAPTAVATLTPAPVAAPMSVATPRESPGTEALPTTAARLRISIQPAYPFRSRLRGEEGEVTLSVEVQADGHARSVIVVRSSGHERLDTAAVAAARDADYVPARRGVVAMDGRMELRFRFVLTSGRATDRGVRPPETAAL